MTYLRNPTPQKASNQVLVPLQLRLDDNERKVGFGVHVARHFFHFFNLPLDLVVDALEEAVGGPREKFGRRPLGYPGARQVLQVARFWRDRRVRDRVDFAEDVVDVHCSCR